MKLKISDIKVKDGRREISEDIVMQLAESMEQIGLINPIAVDKDNVLIAGAHRLEAAKLLGWEEIECGVMDIAGLQAELAEIDENIVRSDLSTLDYGEILLRRKEIYEMLHPETKVGIAQAAAMNRSVGNNVSDKMSLTSKTFVQDTAEKLGVVPRTVEREIQTAKNLTPETKAIIREADTKITKEAALKLARMEPEQQKEAAELLASKQIKRVEEYQKPISPPVVQKSQQEPDTTPVIKFPVPEKKHCTLKETIAELKDVDKDCSATPHDFVLEYCANAEAAVRGLEWYTQEYYLGVYPYLDNDQILKIQSANHAIAAAMKKISKLMERKVKHEA